MPKHLPKAVLDRTDELPKDPWKRLREKPGVKVLSVTRRILWVLNCPHLTV